MLRDPSHLLAALGLMTLPYFATGQTITYEWLNVPCNENLNCSSGCSACNLPANGASTFQGTNVVWSGIGTCPHPIAVGDNAVYTEGWPISTEPQVFVGISAIAVEPLQVDTIMIRHRRSADGPQRLSVKFTNNVALAPEVIGDVEVTQQFQETVFTDLGCLELNEGSAYSAMQLLLQVYQGGEGGDWQLDAMRIVARPCNASQVGIAENFQRTLHESRTYVDVLGRPVKGQPAPGMYIGGRKRIQVL